MFNDIIQKIQALSGSTKNIDHSFVYDEILKKTYQLEWLINQVKILNKEFVDDLADSKPDFHVIGVLEIMSEAFYHFAWRIIEIIYKNPDIFGKSNLKDTGVGRVRNQLMLHPEKTGKHKMYPEFSPGGETGPAIKNYIGKPGSYHDQGVFANADEFIKKLSLTLEKTPPNSE